MLTACIAYCEATRYSDVVKSRQWVCRFLDNRKSLTLKQIALTGCGILFVTLGVVGIVVPLLPTTPFLLLASACFLRGSPKLHDWLVNHATFGAILRDWQQHKCIAKKIKLRGAIFICCSFSLSIVMVQSFWLKIALLTLFLVIFTLFLRIPVRQPVDE